MGGKLPLDVLSHEVFKYSITMYSDNKHEIKLDKSLWNTYFFYEESGKKVKLSGKSEDEIVFFFKLDGGIIKESERADLMVFYSNPRISLICIVELKGNNTKKALDQVGNTITELKSKLDLVGFNGKKLVLIIPNPPRRKRAVLSTSMHWHRVLQKELKKYDKHFKLLPFPKTPVVDFKRDIVQAIMP